MVRMYRKKMVFLLKNFQILLHSFFFFFLFFFFKGKPNTENYLMLEVRPVSVILLTYMPAVSILAKYKTLGLGREPNTTKSSFMVLPYLASASMHRLPSLYTCTTWSQINLLSKHLQSHKRGDYGLLVSTLELTRSTTTFTSNSTINLWIPSLKASFKPSLKAQNLVVILVANPMDLANHLNQFPLQSLIKPPPPTLPRFP